MSYERLSHYNLKLPGQNASRISERYNSRLTERIFSLLVFLTFIGAVYIVYMQQSKLASSESSTIAGKSFSIVLFGDSLLNIPCQKFSLQNKIEDKFPSYLLNIKNAGINGDRISFMRARMAEDVLAYQADAVFLFWDSDISDQSVSVLALNETQNKYEEDLRYVVTTLKQNCTYLALAGDAFCLFISIDPA